MKQKTLIVTEQAVGMLLALDAIDGSVNWKYRNKRLLDFPALVRGHIGTETVCVMASANGFLVAFRLTDGMALWELTLSRVPIPRSSGPGQVHAITNGSTVILQYGHRFIAVSVQDGSVLWEYTSISFRVWLLTMGITRFYLLEDPPLHPIPATAAEREAEREAYLAERMEKQKHGSRPHTMITRALSVQDGSPLWSTTAFTLLQPPGDGEGVSSLMEEGEMLYAYGWGGLYALEANSGQTVWVNTDVPKYPVGQLLLSSELPLLTLGSKSDLRAYRKQDGALIWSATTTTPQTDQSGGLRETFCRALEAGETFYIGLDLHNSAGFQGFQIEEWKLTTGQHRIVWQCPGGEEEMFHMWRFQAVGDRLFVPTHTALLTIDSSDGRTLWSSPLDGARRSFLVAPLS